MNSSTRKITAEDLYKLSWVESPVLSPRDGSIAYVSKVVSKDQDGYRSHIRLISGGSRQDRPFTSGEHDSAPAWSPDGTILAFLRKKNEAVQVWFLQADGGEARPITDLKHGVSAFKWSPDGKQLLLRASAADSEEEQEENKDEKSKNEAKDIVVDRIRYKSDGAGLWNGRRSHLFIWHIEASQSTPLTRGNYDISFFAWSPDGRQVAFTSDIVEDGSRNPDLSLFNELYIVQADGSGRRQLTQGGLSIGPIAFTPDGEKILMLADNLSHGFATLSRIQLISAAGGEIRQLYSDMDVQLGHAAVSDMRAAAGTPPLFSRDGRSVYLQTTREGSVQIVQFALDGSGSEVIVGGEREVYQFDVSAQGDLVYAAADPLQPGDLFFRASGQAEEERLTNCNAKLFEELELSVPETFWFTTSDGWDIQGWMMKPVGFKEGSKVPAVLEIHGGPQAMYGHTFMHEFQLIAAAGYAVFYTNPRGGHGYGQVHVNTVRGDYGGRDYQDVMESVDYVLSAYDFVDGDRLSVTGGSYGGFMTNWIVGHTDRFKAAVTQRSICNWLSFYGVSDIGYYFTEDQIWGNPWEDFKKLWKHSPIAYVNEVNTPLLILHGEQDLRCPVEQGEQLFVALKRLGKETQFVRFPGADHNLSRSGHPQLRVKRLNHIVRWFNEHIVKLSE
ncbi:S9 family peptidase [Paenibacillus sp. JX-17]|uniref:S9 family peptidase n=1 Tax=Paenibacillus lacisoli TaxID=3064525 RepID=A0ABT9C7T7_9BACL|nr:S9 family peptidase [Paenibacillus sp. JX-17]MDO7905295.1 S9 family peptidase [Paenibacillus sp. JX-17]